MAQGWRASVQSLHAMRSTYGDPKMVLLLRGVFGQGPNLGSKKEASTRKTKRREEAKRPDIASIHGESNMFKKSPVSRHQDKPKSQTKRKTCPACRSLDPDRHGMMWWAVLSRRGQRTIIWYRRKGCTCPGRRTHISL